jgi:hypothetical protein
MPPLTDNMDFPIAASRNSVKGRKELCDNTHPMWDTVSHLLARVMTALWFAGVILMGITIPACIYKIFSALWEPDDPEEKQTVSDKVS